MNGLNKASIEGLLNRGELHSNTSIEVGSESYDKGNLKAFYSLANDILGDKKLIYRLKEEGIMYLHFRVFIFKRKYNKSNLILDLKRKECLIRVIKKFGGDTYLINSHAYYKLCELPYTV